MNHDWNVREVRSATIEYVVQQCGEPPRGSGGPTADYRAALAGCARALGLPAGGEGQLWEWLQDRSLRGSYDKGERHDAPGGDARRGFLEVAFEEGQEDPLTLRAASLPEIAEGVVPATIADPLTALLQEEYGVLSEVERRQMAEALERGESLPREARLALAVQLRGSSLAGRRELVRAVLDYISPPGEGSTCHIWEKRHCRLPLAAGETWEHLPLLGVSLPQHHLTGRTLLLIRNAGGAVRAAHPFVRVRRELPGEARGGRALRCYHLAPRETFARDLVLRQFALLASMVRNDGRTAKGWAQLFGETKAAASWNRKRLDERVRKDSGSVVGFRGLRAKPDPRKGTGKAK